MANLLLFPTSYGAAPADVTASLTLDDFILDALGVVGIDANGSSALADVTADGGSSAAISAAGSPTLADQTVDANTNAENNAAGSVAQNDLTLDANAAAVINAAGALTLSDQTVDGSSNAGINAAAANVQDEIIVSADIDNEIIAAAQNILDNATVNGGATAAFPGIIAVISDLTLTGHPELVRTALLAGAGGLLTEANVAIRNGGFPADLDYARSVGAQMVIRSMSGLTGYIADALSYYKDHGIQSFIPPGSNTPGELFESNGGTNLPSIIVTGAGDVNNETADDVEFFSSDVVSIEPDLSSYSNGYIAGQVFFIKCMRNSSWWEARYAARMTASEGGVWDELNGYGLIDVDAAILFGGSVPEDPFAGIIRTITALLQLDDFILDALIFGNVLSPKIILNGRERPIIFKGDKKKYLFKNRIRKLIFD